MALSNILSPRYQVQNAKGEALAGGKVFLYEPGTTTFITSYRDSGLVTPHQNPVKLSGSGRANIWISRNCDMRITDRSGSPDQEGNLVIEELNANPDILGEDQAGGLVANGSFEFDTDANNIPDGWTLVNETGSNNALDTSQSTDGAQSFRFTSAGNGGGSLTNENFFPVNDVDPLRVNFDIRSTVATVRNIVRVEWYDISQVSISNSDIYDSTSNPTSFTSQNLLATAPANARFAKLRLIGCDPSVATPGSTYFDRASAFYPALVNGVFDNITIQSNEIISTNTNGNIDIVPNGTGDLQLGNSSQANISIDATGEIELDRASGLLKLRTQVSGVNIRGSLGNAVGGAQDATIQLQNSVGTNVGLLSYLSSDDLYLRNQNHGGNLILESENLVGSVHTFFQGDPDGVASLNSVGNLTIRTNTEPAIVCNANAGVAFYYDSQLVMQTAGADTVSIRGNNNAPNLSLTNNSGVTIGSFSATTAGGVRVSSTSNGLPVVIDGPDVGGVLRSMFSSDPDSETVVFHQGTRALSTIDSGIRVFSGISDNPILEFFQDDSSTRNATIQAFGDGTGLSLLSEVHGAPILLQGENNAGLIQNLFTGDPDSRATLFYAGQPRILTDASGAAAILSSGNTDTENRSLNFLYQNETQRATIGHLVGTGSSFSVRNEIHGGLVVIQGEDAGGVLRNLIVSDPDTDVQLYYAGAPTARTVTAANGGLQVNNGGVFERVLTESDIGASNVVFKQVDTSRSSDASTTADPELDGLSLDSASIYAVEGYLEVRALSATPGFRFTVQRATGTSNDTGYTYTLTDQAAAIRGDHSAFNLIQTETLANGQITGIHISGQIVTSSAVTLAIYWGQNVSDATATTLQRGSWLKATKLGASS